MGVKKFLRVDWTKEITLRRFFIIFVQNLRGFDNRNDTKWALRYFV